MDNKYYEDNWADDEFFNVIEDVMIVQLEKESNIMFQGASRIPKTRLFNTREGIKHLQRNYVYVPNKDRYVANHANDSLSKLHLIDGERIPSHGALYNMYQKKLISFNKQKGVPKLLKQTSAGDIYEVTCLELLGSKVDSSKGYFTVSKTGVISKCNVVTEMYSQGFGQPNMVVDQNSIESEVLSSHFLTAFYGLQFCVDKMHCWTIKADEDNCKVELGCNREQIKSLLYARQEPLTKTGRLSPILHLVASHNRRMKKGTEINSVDVKSYLRGQQTIDIGSTRFTVCPPPLLGNNLTENSLRYFD